MFYKAIAGFLILFFIFVPLERGFFLHAQKIFRREWETDAIYYFIGYFIGRVTFGISAILADNVLGGLANAELQTLIAKQPIGLQFIETAFIAEIGYYTAHKLTHTLPWLWKFHSIHHSVEEMDWLATVRVHPIDQIFTKMFQLVPLSILGFTNLIESFSIYILFSAFIAFFIHSNLRFKLGFLRWVFATPEFHHWHHSVEPKVYNKNFSAQLPLVDLLLGTLYMPTGKMPDRYGIPDPVPYGYFRQIVYPFRQRKIKA